MNATETFSKNDLTVDATGALAALSRAPEQGVALVEAWVKHNNAAAVAEAADRANGPVRKAARRGLSVLRARGVAIPEKGRVATLGASHEPTSTEAWMLAPDTAGNVLIVLASRSRTSRYRAAFFFVHEQNGIMRVEVAEVSQSGLRESIARVLPGARYKPVSVPVEWARHRVAVAKAAHEASGRPLPLGVSSAQTLLEPVPEAAEHPFDGEGLELSDDDARDLGMDSTKLHSLPEFSGWFPSGPAVDEMLKHLGENVKVEPGESPEADQVQAALEVEIKSATDRYFSPETREALVRTMKDSVLSVLARDGEQQALEVVAAMNCIQNRGLITDPPHEVGFLRGFFEKAVSYLLARGGGSLRIPMPARAAADAPAEPAAMDTGAEVSDG
ncbi:MAG: hypothetical protein R3B13_32230 [Polyangiaceae bacterium]